MRARGRSRASLARIVVLCLVAALAPFVVGQGVAQAVDPCNPLINKVACENSKPGTPKDDWYNTGNYGDIDGFGTAASVQPGETLNFKVSTQSRNYEIDIVRLGWYQGNGGRQVATVTPSVSLPQSQPPCVTDNPTGLVDCGNWAVSAHWSVPSTAVSGFYIATFNRLDAPGVNTFPFVVRDDTSHSDIVVQTSDQTWEAYNTWGGNSLYLGTVGTALPGADGRAYKVSYNRPYNNSGTASWYNAEEPLIRWIERNGYDVSYLSGVDVTRNPALVRNHKTFISSGHDEYWNAAQRTGIEQARAAGVNLMFLSGNEMFWKTRFEPSIDGSNTANRTLVCYKETKANGVKIDPTPAWTGTWRDPRLSPPADGGQPENALTGTLFRVNGPQYGSITVPAQFAHDRIWRNTSITGLTGNQVATFPMGTLGYEYDEDAANSVRPAGAIDVSSTTLNVPDGYFLLDYGNLYGSGTATHSLVLYRDQASGALVFGAGTVEWAWGLDSEHLYPGTSETFPQVVDVRMQQATVNLLADMGAQPGTLQAGLVAATASTDTVGPAVSVTAPAPNSTVPALKPVTVSGTATDSGGGVVARVEISTDGGTSWKPATGTTSWTYAWTPTSMGQQTLLVRAVDDSANIGTIAQRPVTVGPQQCPCTLFGSASAPTVVDAGDPDAVELGVKFTPTVNGTITGVRFYKSAANTGTHTGSLWNLGGTRLATGTFTGESASGWQTLTFASPVQVRGGTTYVASYTTTTGHYSADANYFASSGAGLAPLVAPANGGPAGGQGVYKAPSGFPNSSFNAANYWVDAVYDTVGGDSNPPTVTSHTPASGATNVATESDVTVNFSEPLDPTSVQFSLTAGGNPVPGGPPQMSDDGTSITFTPTDRLAPSTTFSVSVQASDGFGNAMPAPVTWTFATGTDPCPCTLFRNAVPTLQDAGDPNQVELGVKFQTSINTAVTAIKFYKSTNNAGTHTGTLWSSTGTQLATGTFTNETGSGWQTLTFANPVPIQAGKTYVASYNAPSGHYAAAGGYFNTSGAGTAPLTAPSSGAVGGQGVYKYGTGFPAQSYNGTNYYVDVVVATQGADTTPPSVTSTVPASGATGVSVSGSVTANFSEPVDPATVTFTVTPSGGSPAPGTLTVAPDGTSATFNPTSDLAAGTLHTASVQASDPLGNTMPSATTWSFTTASGGPVCPCTVFRNTDTPAGSDTDAALELGMKWRSTVDGFVTGVRFYKATGDTGTHTGSLWSSTGALLATGTYTGESGSGWQTLTFTSPVAVTAATTYVTSYYTPAGKFRYTAGYFSGPQTVGPLTGLANGTDGPNGVFKYGIGGGFPAGNGNSTNYWSDVVFTTAP
jgi:hypothetical protein